MKYISLLAILIIAVFLTDCGGEKQEEIKQSIQIAQKAGEIAKQVDNSRQAAEQRRAERVKKGDTLAMHFSKLQNYLPPGISGYSAEEPAGESVSLAGVSYSNVSRRFTKQVGQENAEIDITILDYNATSELFFGAAYWMAGISREDNNSYDRTFDPGIKWVYGFEHFDKVSKTASVSLGIGFRFLITINGTHLESPEPLKAIAKSMKLAEMANM